ncbi:hypothetical protein [Nonomuraea sp. NPDC049725]|uniref:hypothetical protein n=1 Tax=Nonomuraea sp. NPDC049725 TaxID=3154508 RepID=UPI003443C0E8
MTTVDPVSSMEVAATRSHGSGFDGGRLNRTFTVNVRPSGDSVTFLTSRHCDVLHPAKASATHAAGSALPTMLVLRVAIESAFLACVS